MPDSTPGTDDKALAKRVIVVASSNYTDGVDGSVKTTINYDANDNPTEFIKVVGNASYSKIVAFDASDNATNLGSWSQL